MWLPICSRTLCTSFKNETLKVAIKAQKIEIRYSQDPNSASKVINYIEEKIWEANQTSLSNTYKSMQFVA